MNNLDHLVSDNEGKLDFEKALVFLPPNKLYNTTTGKRKSEGQLMSILGQTLSRLNLSEDFIINNIDNLNMSILIINRLVTDKVFETYYERVYRPVHRTLTNGGYVYFNQLMVSVKNKDNKVRIMKDLLNAFYSRKHNTEKEYVKWRLQQITGLKIIKVNMEEK
jgi:hypothetical protein